jgi:hypothetical protein
MDTVFVAVRDVVALNALVSAGGVFSFFWMCLLVGEGEMLRGCDGNGGHLHAGAVYAVVEYHLIERRLRLEEARLVWVICHLVDLGEGFEKVIR